MADAIEIIITAKDQASGPLRKVRDGLDDVDGSTSRAGRGFSSFEQVAIGALRQVGVVALNVALEAGKAMAGFVADSVSAAGDFEAATLNLQAVAGGALAEAGISFDDIRNKALQLGADTQFSAAQAMDAMTELAKGGVNVQDVMNGATDATLMLAAAAGL